MGLRTKVLDIGIGKFGLVPGPSNSQIANPVRLAGTNIKAVLMWEKLFGITGQGGGGGTSPGAATHFVVNAPATATDGTGFAFTVTAEDSGNNVATGYTGTVTFTTTDSSGTLPGFSTLAAGVGTFSATLVISGAQTITATDKTTASITGNSGTITVGAAAATHYGVSMAANATAGTGVAFTVTAYDLNNDVATGYAGTVAFTTGDSSAVSPANSTLAAGVGVFSETFKTSGSQVLTATDANVSSITGKTGTVTVAAGSLTHFGVVAPANATAGTSITSTVTAMDAFNNTITAYTGTVHITSSDSQATLPSNNTLSAGVGTFAVTLKTAAAETVSANDVTTTSLTGVTSTITVAAGTLTHFGITGAATSGVSSVGLGPMTVTAYDAFNNVVTGYTGSVSFTTGDSYSATTLPGYTTLSNGVGTFSATLYTPNNQIITASDRTTSSLSGATPNILIGPPAISNFWAAYLEAYTATGQNVTVATDQFGGKNFTNGAYTAPHFVLNSINGFAAYSSSGSNIGMTAGAASDFTNASFAAWCIFKRLGSSANSALLNKGNGTSIAGSSWEILAQNAAGQVQSDAYPNSTTQATSIVYAFSTNYEFVLVTRNGSTGVRTLYKNGVQQSTTTDSPATLNNPGITPSFNELLGMFNSGDSGNHLACNQVSIAALGYNSGTISAAIQSQLVSFAGALTKLF